MTTTKRRCAGCSAVITGGRSNRRYCSERCRERYKKRRQTGEKFSPVSQVDSVIRTQSNGVLIATVSRLGYLGGPTSTVLDVTYGEGSFWTRYRPTGLIAHDLHKLDGVSYHDLPEADGSIEVVVFDPPYISTGNRETSSVDDLYDRFGLGELTGWKAVRRDIDIGLAECSRVLATKGYLLVKCMDYVESGRKVWNTFHVAAEAGSLGLRLVDRFHHLTGGGPQPKDNLDGSPREQRTAREVTSMLLVFTK